MHSVCLQYQCLHVCSMHVWMYEIDPHQTTPIFTATGLVEAQDTAVEVYRLFWSKFLDRSLHTFSILLFSVLGIPLSCLLLPSWVNATVWNVSHSCCNVMLRLSVCWSLRSYPWFQSLKPKLTWWPFHRFPCRNLVTTFPSSNSWGSCNLPPAPLLRPPRNTKGGSAAPGR